MKQYTYILLVGALIIGLASCQAPGGNSPGSEYMPDMGHSIAYEANHYNYYYNNTWGSEAEYHAYSQPRKPVNGTVPRTKTDFKSSNTAIAIPTQVGSTTYPYMDTEEERTRAMNELIKNPYPITDAGLATGKELYTIFCATCHGDKGDGGGYLVREDGGKYPAQPANFLLKEHLEASNGRYYHAIMHGKNLMGGYSDKINTEERWQVIHWIRSLQAKELKLEYNQMVNTLNAIDMPAGEIAQVMEENHGDHDAHHSEEGHEAHGHDGQNDEGHDHDSHDNDTHDHGEEH